MKHKQLFLSFFLSIDLGQPVMAADTAKPASEATKDANAAVLKELPFNNKQAFEDSKKGFIAPLENNGVVKNDKGDVIWDLTKFDFLKGDKPAPDTVNPSLWRQAQIMEHFTGLFEVTKGIYQVRGLDISNITFIEAPEGVIVMDPLVSAEVAKAGLELYHRGGHLQPFPH